MKKTQNFLDKIVSFVDPKKGIERLKARDAITEFAYMAARPTRERTLQPLVGNSSSESGMNQRDRIQLIWEARYLVSNFPLIKGIVRKLSLYTFSTIRWQQRTDDQKVNQQYEDYLARWMKNCDIGGRHSFTALVNIIFIAMIRDGDCGVVIRWTPDGPKLQIVEADRIGRPLEAPQGDIYVGGVTRDPDTGAPVSYRVYDRTREGMYISAVEVPANRFIHVFDPMRIDQVRGVTHFEAAIDTARDIYDIVNYEKFAVKWASAQTGVVTRNEGEADQWETGQNPNGGQRLENIEFGRINYLEQGENIQSFMSSRPAATFSGFIQTLQRDVCHCLGAPFGFFVDNSALGGNAGRMDSQQANRVCERHQQNFIDKLLDKVKDAAIAWGISQGEIPAHPQWRSGKWQFPAWPTADIGRDSAAAIEEYKIGLRTAADIYSEQNKDWESEFQQVAREQKMLQELADKMGMPVDRLSQRSPNIAPDEDQGAQKQGLAEVKKKDLTELKEEKPLNKGERWVTGRNGQRFIVGAEKKSTKAKGTIGVKSQRGIDSHKAQSSAAVGESKRWEHLIGKRLNATVAEHQPSLVHGKLVHNPSDLWMKVKMADGTTRKMLAEVKAVGVLGYEPNELKVTSRSECRARKHAEAKAKNTPIITIAIDARKAKRGPDGIHVSMSNATFYLYRGVGSPRLTTRYAQTNGFKAGKLLEMVKGINKSTPTAGNDPQNDLYFKKIHGKI